MSKKIKEEILFWLKAIPFCIALAICLNTFVVVNASVPTPSMENTIKVGERFIAFRHAYLFSEPERFDVIVFDAPNKDELYVKRIIGMPGETVTIIDGDVYIDDSDIPLDNSFEPEKMYGSFGPYEIPTDAYFVMGDNRNHSADARSWKEPYLLKEAIRGKAIFKYFPIPKMIR